MSLQVNRFCLLELPPELRLKIWEHVVRFNPDETSLDGPKDTITLLCVSRQIFLETLPIGRPIIGSYIRYLKDQIEELPGVRNSAGDFGTILTNLCLRDIYQNRSERLSRALRRWSKLERMICS